MTTSYLKPSATADIVGQAVGVRIAGGTVELDAFGIPYGKASLELPRTEDLELEDMDPRSDTRIIVTGRDDVAGTSRSFNLGLRARDISENGSTVLLELATDEALLQDYAPLTTDTGARAHQGSIRAVVNYVLGKIGASLQPGGPDADVTAYWLVGNVLSNPSVELTTTPWSNGGGMQSFHAGLAMPGAGVNAFGWNSTGAGVLAFVPHVSLQGPSVSPGRSYVFSGFGLAYLSTPARTIRACIRWLDGSGTPVGPDLEGPNIPINPTTWTRCSIIGTAPAGASRAEVFYRVAGGTASGQIGYADGAMFYEGTELVPYFDGSTPDTASYSYDWATNPHASGSTRTPAVVREPDLYVWRPGVSAWDFLEPLTTSVGYRLYCDELRRWWLIDPKTHAVPGVVTLSGFNIANGADTISRDDPELFATGVVVEYSWKDPSTQADRVAYDSAGTPSKVVVVQYERPYPGPGAAAAILSRRSGTGRTQTATALVDWTTTPGMEASLTLPASEQTRGKVASVRFELGDSGLMDVGTRGLIDIHPGTIDALVGTIDGLVGTIDALA